MDWDDDIAAMPITDFEKDGLQVYRNYQRAFENHAERDLAKEVDAEAFSTVSLERVLKLMVTEDPRSLPVIACAYADDHLKEIFKAQIPKNVPGGKARLLGPYGPFSDLFKRLQLAYIFEMLSADLVVDLDRLRKARNKLSHTWDISKLNDFFAREPISDIFPVETLLAEDPDRFPNLASSLDVLQAFRLRIVWILTRLTYEAPLYMRARQRRLDSRKALYGENHPKRLEKFSRLAMTICDNIVSA